MPVSVASQVPRGERGCLGRSWLLQVTAPHSLSGRCWARALMLSSLAEGPRTYSVLLGGEGHSTGCPGVIQRAAAALPIGPGYKASLCGSRQGRAWESLRVTSLSPIPTWGQALSPSEPVCSLRNEISNLSFNSPVLMKWHSPAWRLPGGGGLLARGVEEVWGVGELRALIVLASAQPLVSHVTSRDHLPHRLFLSPPGRWRWWWLWVVFVEVDSVPSGAEFGALGRCEPSLGDQVPLGKKRTASCSLSRREGSPGHPGQQARATRARGAGPRLSRGWQE